MKIKQNINNLTKSKYQPLETIATLGVLGGSFAAGYYLGDFQQNADPHWLNYALIPVGTLAGSIIGATAAGIFQAKKTYGFEALGILISAPILGAIGSVVGQSIGYTAGYFF